ncbi:MAG TPA: hypothetical protein VH089_14390 [Streptosporangiaceae bacterium]|nr:hypothetical protein [Streptosporangiaceae bacterium]
MTASAASVQAGGTILYRIEAYTNTAATSGTIATALSPSAKTPAFGAPKYTVDTCTSVSGTTCTLGTVADKQPSGPQFEVQVQVPKNAPAGEKISYRATLKVTNSTGSASKAANAPTVTVAKAASSSPTASKSPSAGSGNGSTTTPAVDGSTATISGLSGSLGDGTSIPVGPLPAVAGVSTTIPGGNASNLFPQISPSSTPSPAAGTPAVANGAQPVADSSRIPLALGSSEFGAQIVGLIVLLLGVAIAVTRLSIRRKSTPGTK